MQASITEDRRVVILIEIVTGTAVIAVAAAVSVVLFPGTELAGRALITAVTAGVVAARVRHWQSSAVAAVAAVLILPLFLAEVATAVMRWGFSPLFVLALMLGRGFRFLVHQSSQQYAGGRYPTGRATDDSSLFIWPDRPTAAPPDDPTDDHIGSAPMSFSAALSSEIRDIGRVLPGEPRFRHRWWLRNWGTIDPLD